MHSQWRLSRASHTRPEWQACGLVGNEMTASMTGWCFFNLYLTRRTWRRGPTSSTADVFWYIVFQSTYLIEPLTKKLHINMILKMAPVLENVCEVFILLFSQSKDSDLNVPLSATSSSSFLLSRLRPWPFPLKEKPLRTQSSASCPEVELMRS